MTVVLDYGMGNLRSVERAISHLGFSCSIQSDLRGASKLIIPGVGAFTAAMERLQPLKKDIQAFAASGGPLLGICLGQQLLFEESEEHASSKGLEILPGKVRYLPGNREIKVPHVGWNELAWLSSDGLAVGAQNGEQAYFVHSLYASCDEESDVAAWTTHGIEFAAAVMRDNVWGTQFHPEKSGEVGLRILKNYLAC